MGSPIRGRAVRWRLVGEGGIPESAHRFTWSSLRADQRRQTCTWENQRRVGWLGRVALSLAARLWVH